MQNRRQEGRLSEEHKVTYVIVSEEKNPIDDKIYYALTEDISTSGMKLITEKPLEIGTFVKIELSLGGEKKFINLFGEVRWIKNLYDDELFTTGITFVKNPPKNIITLMEHVFKKD
jgi:c-di-GMP-binding flagellar brake protein YcgR